MVTEFQEGIEAVAEENGADVFLYAGPLTSGWDEDFISKCPDKSDHDNAVLYLTTLGGSADVAYRIARHLQERYSEGRTILIVNSMCKSAGTLNAVGAHTIAMSDRGELGPLDVQIGERDEVFVYHSGLVAAQALEVLQHRSFEYFENAFLNLASKSGGRITTRTAAELATSLTGSLFGNIYAQLDPMRLGENYRHMLVAESYADRLAGATGVSEETVSRLLTAYPSHEFVIDRMEAGRLFPDVRELSESEAELADIVKPIADSGLVSSTPSVVHLTGTPGEISVISALLAHRRERGQNEQESEGSVTGREHEEGLEEELKAGEDADQASAAE